MRLKLFGFEVSNEARSYSDAITDAIVAAAASGNVDAGNSATARACASLWGRALSSATIKPDNLAAVISPDWLASVGTDLILRGQHLSAISVDAVSGLRLQRAASWDVTGSAAPWSYRVDVAAPSGTQSRRLNAESIVSLTWESSLQQPWAGVGPLTCTAARALAALELSLLQESLTPTGFVLPTPQDPQDPGLTALAGDLKTLGGKLAVVETMASNWQQGGQGPQSDWKSMRLGPNPPEQLSALRDALASDTASACGVPAGMMAAKSDGTFLRESWRIMLHSSVGPIARRLEAELSNKLDADVQLDFTRLQASDVQGRARSAATLAKAGLDIDAALKLAGFDA